LVRTIGQDLEAEDLFLGFAEVSSTTGEALKSVIQDSLQRFALDIHDCRGQAYDGASNMSGRFKWPSGEDQS